MIFASCRKFGFRKLSRNSLALAALALLAAALRWWTHTPVVYNWDSVHYLLALDRYDILAHQPHPPGSYYYILLVRAVRLLTREPHAALLLISAFSGAGYVLVLYRLGKELGGSAAGWLAAVTAATAPLFWFYGSVGLNYGPTGVLTAGAALACLLYMGEGKPGSALLAGATLGVLGGFRPTDVVFLTPAYAWALWIGSGQGQTGTPGARLRVALASMAAAGLLTLGWLVPNIVNTGGVSQYVGSLRGQEHLLSRSSALVSGWPALYEAWITHRRSLESALGAGWLLLFIAGAGAALRSLRRPMVSFPGGLPGTVPRVWVLGVLIVAPAFFFYLLGHFNSPGYALTYAGFVAAALSAVTVRLAARFMAAGGCPADSPFAHPRLIPAILLLLALVNGRLFLAGWPGWGPLAQRSLSYAEIRDHAEYYRNLRRFLAAHHAPGQVRLLVSWNSTDGLRTVQHLLPEYAADTVQAVAAMPELPPGFARLSFLRLITPAQLRREGLPTYALLRSWEDLPYHTGLWQRQWERIDIGGGHDLLRIRLDGP